MSRMSLQKLFRKKLDQIEPESGAYSGNGILDTEIRLPSFDLPDRSELDMLRGSRVELPDIGPNHFSAIESETEPSVSDKVLDTVFGPLYRHVKGTSKRRDK